MIQFVNGILCYVAQTYFIEDIDVASILKHKQLTTLRRLCIVVSPSYVAFQFKKLLKQRITKLEKQLL